METRRMIVIPIDGTVIFPHSKAKLSVDETYGKYIYDLMQERDIQALTIARKPDSKDFYAIGVLVELYKIKKSSDGYLIDVISSDKVEAFHFDTSGSHITADVRPIFEEEEMNELAYASMLDFLKKAVHEVGEKFPGTEQQLKHLDQLTSIDQLLSEVVPFMNVPMDQKQKMVELNSTKRRGLFAIEVLKKQKDAIDLQIEMAKKYSSQNNKTYRHQLLREQMKAIQEELNEESEEGENYQERIEASDMPEKVKKVAMSEFRKLERNHQNNSENNVIRNYLDLLLELPWGKADPTELDLQYAKDVLEEEHYGLEEVKKRIIQHLAVMKLKKEKQGSILLLVGPPGTGKTSLGKSIARSLNREYVRMSLGGVRDEAEIRGHRKTYIGAMPGRIIQGMKQSGTTNPVFILDEIDKLSASHNGDPASALLEVLDPEQNDTFADHFLNVDYDLSDVFFIATANNLSTIPGPLRDRMEIIQISSYTDKEKFQIAKRHLMPQVLEDHGLSKKELQVTPRALEEIVNQYTREAGVRGLKKQLSKVARVVSEKVVSGQVDGTFKLKLSNLEDVLGKPRVRHEEAGKENNPGVVTGLAWTPVGGEILFIEGTVMPGKGSLTLTGQLGAVMKESAQIAKSLIRSRLANEPQMVHFNKFDMHIHVPSGATPKDGPSAGVALTTAIASLVLGKKVDSKLAMTGEITLRGSVMPVGGIKEKVLAAHRAGVERVILPKDNERDIMDIPEEVRKELDFKLVSTIEEVFEYVFDMKLQVPSFTYDFMVDQEADHGVS